jgi:hypothetical protein
MHTNLKSKLLAAVAAIGMMAAACGTDDAPLDATPGGENDLVIEIGGENVLLTSALSGFDSCANLLDHLRTEGAERVGPWGFNDGWYGGWWPVDGPGVLAVDDVAADFDTAESAPTAAQGGDDGAADLTEGVDFSGTNVQETGVDEADVVKTDGERIYIVANGELVVVDVASRSVVGTVKVPQGDRAELFLDGNDLLLINQSWHDGDFGIAEDAEEDLAADIAGPYFPGSSRTTITRITVDGNTPRILETLAAEGDYISARAVDGTARIIVRSNPQYNFPFVYPQGEAGEDRAEQSNREAILDSELTDWLPSYALLDANGSQTGDGLLVPCEQVHAPTEFAGFGVLSVLTVDVDHHLVRPQHPRHRPRPDRRERHHFHPSLRHRLRILRRLHGQRFRGRSDPGQLLVQRARGTSAGGHHHRQQLGRDLRVVRAGLDRGRRRTGRGRLCRQHRQR